MKDKCKKCGYAITGGFYSDGEGGVLHPYCHEVARNEQKETDFSHLVNAAADPKLVRDLLNLFVPEETKLKVLIHYNLNRQNDIARRFANDAHGLLDAMESKGGETDGEV